MSGFTEHELFLVHKKYNKVFEELSQIAAENDIFLRLSLSPSGDIVLKSTEYLVEEEKVFRRVHKVATGNDYVSQSSRTSELLN